LAANKICLCFQGIFVDKRRSWQAAILRLDMFGLLLATFLSLSQPWPGKHFKLLADQQKDGRIEMGVAEPIAMLIARLLTF